MKALLLAGGRGTRMRPLTHTKNKHAIPIANKPLIEYPIEMILEAGIRELFVVVNETKPEIEEILGDGSRWGAKITYLFQDHPGGLAHALGLAEGHIGEGKFVMVLGDNILEKGIKKHVSEFENSDASGHILGVKVPIDEHKRFGMATVNKNNELLVYLEKPGVVDHSDLYNPNMSYAVPGFYFFDHNIFKCFHGDDKIKPSVRGELEIPAPYNWLINNGYKVTLSLVKGWYKDPGNPDDTLSTNHVILDSFVVSQNRGFIDDASRVTGRVSIGKGSKIINSIIRGPVAIGDNCTIKDSYIGPFTSIYHSSSIINCELENSLIMGDVRLENVPQRIDSSLIGWNAEILKREERGTSVNLLVGDRSVVKL